MVLGGRFEGMVENLPGSYAAFATLAGNTQTIAQLSYGSCPVFNGLPDLAISHTFTQAYVHEELIRRRESDLLRILIIMRIFVNNGAAGVGQKIFIIHNRCHRRQEGAIGVI